MLLPDVLAGVKFTNGETPEKTAAWSQRHQRHLTIAQRLIHDDDEHAGHAGEDEDEHDTHGDAAEEGPDEHQPGLGRDGHEEATGSHMRPESTTLCIIGMDCPDEIAALRECLQGVEGVAGLSFNLMQAAMAVEH